MSTRPEQPSTGERVVLCSRPDCAFSGDEVPWGIAKPIPKPALPLFLCEADVIVLDRRAKFRKTCGRFARKG